MPWVLDPAHSSIEFTGKHMMISTVRGHFNSFTATVDLNTDDLTKSTVEAVIDTQSLETRNEQRNGHLKSADFFDVENWPDITFKSTSISHVKDDNYLLNGDLTVRGVTKPVTLDTVFEGLNTSPWGTQVAGFSARSTINRKDWGLVWNVGLETGGVLVSDKINLNFEIELIKQEAPVAAEAAEAVAL